MKRGTLLKMHSYLVMFMACLGLFQHTFLATNTNTNTSVDSNTGEQKVYDFDELSDIQVAGTYPIRIYYIDEATGKQEERISYITVTYPRTVIDEGTGEAIDALDVQVSAGTMKNITDESLIKITHAHAWNVKDGTPIPITHVTYHKNWDKLNLYTATFATAKGTTTAVTILETGENRLVLNENYIELIQIESKIERQWMVAFSALAGSLVLVILFVYLVVYVEVQQAHKVLHDEKIDMK